VTGWRAREEVGNQKEVRAGAGGVCGARHFSLEHVVERADSAVRDECESAGRDAGDSGIVCVSGGAVLLAGSG